MAIQSITVNAGQKIYIPRNATVKGKYLSGSASADSECVDLDDVEDLACFVFMLAGNDDDGDKDQFLDPGNGFVFGIKVDGVEYQFEAVTTEDSLNGGYNYLSIIDKIKAIPQASSLMFNLNGTLHQSSPASGAITYICFQTFPSLGVKMSLSLAMRDDNVGDSYNVYTDVPAKFLTDFSEYPGICTCDASKPVD